MELYKQLKSAETPEIYGSVDEGVIRVRGVCRPTNSIDFFRDFISWVNFFSVANTSEVILVEINLEYMNTSSGMILYRVLSSIKSKLKPDQLLDITWLHDKKDLDMKQVGEDFRYMLGDVLKTKAA